MGSAAKALSTDGDGEGEIISEDASTSTSRVLPLVLLALLVVTALSVDCLTVGALTAIGVSMDATFDQIQRDLDYPETSWSDTRHSVSYPRSG